MQIGANSNSRGEVQDFHLTVIVKEFSPGDANFRELLCVVVSSLCNTIIAKSYNCVVLKVVGRDDRVAECIGVG